MLVKGISFLASSLREKAPTSIVWTLVCRGRQHVARSLTNREFAIPSGDFAMVARKLTGVFTFIAVLKAEFNGYAIVEPYLDRVTA